MKKVNSSPTQNQSWTGIWQKNRDMFEHESDSPKLTRDIATKHKNGRIACNMLAKVFNILPHIFVEYSMSGRILPTTISQHYFYMLRHSQLMSSHVNILIMFKYVSKMSAWQMQITKQGQQIFLVSPWTSAKLFIWIHMKQFNRDSLKYISGDNHWIYLANLHNQFEHPAH